MGANEEPGSLADKLKSLGVRLGGQGLPPHPPRQDHPIETVVPGDFLATLYGEAFRTLASYPPDYRHGNGDLNVTASIHHMAEWGKAGELAEDPGVNFYFLDTETSGLAGGTGTYAFLVGVGRYTEGGFELAQFFMRDPSEETAMLAALSQYLTDCRALVTFNGKAFDVPLLNTRYALQSLTNPLSGLPHFDLLPLARRLWRDRLPSRTLGALEAAILGAARTQEEVPGWMIPEMYFEYLRSRDARPLAGVFYHNAMDVLSLAGLFRYTVQLLANPLAEEVIESLDVVALARLFEDLGYEEAAVQLYQRGIALGLPEENRWPAVERFALLHKRRGEWKEACALWELAAGSGQIFACVELAKYYEHRAREYAQALHWTELALEVVLAPGFPAYLKRQMRGELLHRLERLQKRCAPGRDGLPPGDDMG